MSHFLTEYTEKSYSLFCDLVSNYSDTPKITKIMIGEPFLDGSCVLAAGYEITAYNIGLSQEEITKIGDELHYKKNSDGLYDLTWNRYLNVECPLCGGDLFVLRNNKRSKGGGFIFECENPECSYTYQMKQ